MGTTYRDETTAARSRAESLEEDLEEHRALVERQRGRIRDLEGALETTRTEDELKSVRPRRKQRLVAVPPKREGADRRLGILLMVIAVLLGGLFARVFLH